MNNILLSSTYFGPVQWYQKLAHGGVCLVERHDHFIKQTYRNRTHIRGKAAGNSGKAPQRGKPHGAGSG